MVLSCLSTLQIDGLVVTESIVDSSLRLRDFGDRSRLRDFGDRSRSRCCSSQLDLNLVVAPRNVRSFSSGHFY